MLSKQLFSVYENRNSTACKILATVSQQNSSGHLDKLTENLSVSGCDPHCQSCDVASQCVSGKCDEGYKFDSASKSCKSKSVYYQEYTYKIKTG